MDEQKNTLVMPDIRVSPNKLEAYIILKPSPEGIELNLKNLFNAIKNKGIANKLIDAKAVEELSKNPVISSPVRIAKGIESGSGTDARVVFGFQIARSIKPKEKEDGTVDFKDLGLIQKVNQGDLLAQKTPRVDGRKGMNVFGEEIPPQPAKDYNIPVGRNVELSPDKLKLYSRIDGQVVYLNDRISVLEEFVVDGDVSVSTGNIDFNGNIFIKGNVNSGFKVSAVGDIVVNGVVEMAELVSGGNIIIRSGFNGGEKGSLKAGGSISSKFIQSGTLVAGRNIETTYLYNSIVRCEDTINMVGKGVILGGTVSARKRINANVVGGDNAPKTTLEVGSDPETVKRNGELAEEISACEKNIKALDTAVAQLSALKEAGKLPADKESSLTKSEEVLEKLKSSLNQLLLEQKIIEEKLTQVGKGYIAVKNAAYPGVVISMGSERLVLNSKYTYTLFSRNEGYIKSGPL